MRIYTRTGDDGSTGLFGGARIGKDDLRIEAYGTIDELNAWIGKIATHDAAEPSARPCKPSKANCSHWAVTWPPRTPSGLPNCPHSTPMAPKDSSLGWTNLNRACRRSQASCCPGASRSRRCPCGTHRPSQGRAPLRFSSPGNKIRSCGVDLPQSTFGRLVHGWQVAHPCHGQPRHSLETQ